MKKKIGVILTVMSVCLSVFAIIISTCYAAPVIAGVSGIYKDGQVVTLTGSGFSSNTAVGTSNLEFLGGTGGPINSGIIGAEFSRINWDIDTEWGYDVQNSTDNCFFGSKCLQMVYVSGSYDPEAPLYYKLPSPVTSSDRLFISWWEMTTWTGNGQYKILRLSPTETIIDSPGNQDVYFFHNNSGAVTYGIDGGPYALYPSFSPALPKSTWTRTDIDIKTSTPNSVSITKYTPGSSVKTTSASSYSSGAGNSEWNWIVWQNYFGTDGAGQMTAGSVWFEDMFVQHGSSARVELCDSSTWSSRKSCFIQPPTSWGSTIGVTLNQGTFTGGAIACLYVIDASGNVSNGHAITIGSGSAAAAGPKVTSVQ